MSNLLFYVILTFILFEAVVLFYREYFGKKEQKMLAAGRVLFTGTPAFEVVMLPFVAFFIGYFASSFFKFNSDMETWVVITSVSAVVTALLVYKDLKWMHFMEDKIIIRNPLLNRPVEIVVADIIIAGHKYRYKNSYCFIVVKQGDKTKTIPLHYIQLDHYEDLLKYFTSRKIKYERVGMFDSISGRL